MNEQNIEIPRLNNLDRLYIGGDWISPSTDSSIVVYNSGTGQPFMSFAEATFTDVCLAVSAARTAFDDGPWARMTHRERASYLTAIADGMRARTEEFGRIWTIESGVLYREAKSIGSDMAEMFDYYASIADTFPWETPAKPTTGTFGLIVREPVGVVGAIVPWNGSLPTIARKIAPALLAGCTTILKSSPEAPGEGHIFAEIVQEAGLPDGVVNVLTADREASEELVRNPGVDKITFTGSTAAGRRIGAICGERVARCTLELGGKSAAVVLDDAEIDTVAATLTDATVYLSGQVCSALTRVVVRRERHDELLDALAASFSAVTVGDPFAAGTRMGPLACERQRDKVLSYVERGVSEGAILATGGDVPVGQDRGWYVSPTVFGNVRNQSVIGQEEIFGPVLCVIPCADDDDAIRIANDSPYGLNASVFTSDDDRARTVAAGIRAGTVGQNAFRSDLGIAFGGFKMSGIGREGGTEGVYPFTETKTVILDGPPAAYRA